MPDMFSTNVLIGVVASLTRAPQALLDRYFTTEITDPSEEIHFDMIPGARRIAPFVSPLREGKVVQSLGHTAKTFKPAYVKDKREFDPNRPMKRAVGEQIGGSLTPEQRMQLHLATEMQDQVDMLNRRLEVMASEAIRTGKVTVTGEGYPSVEVDFGRDNTLTGTALSSTARWDDSAPDPLADLDEWSELVLDKSSAFPVDVIMGLDAWRSFKEDEKVAKRLLALNTSGVNMTQAAQPAEGMHYKGTIDGFNIFSYAGWYEDPETGTNTEIWPGNQVAMTSSLIEGARAFGAIKDGKAGYRAMPFFPKSWEDEDPAVRWLMMQSAPLVVPRRVDASFCIEVQAA